MAHVRIDTDQMNLILNEVKRGISKNLDSVNEQNFPEASGYARGTLMGIQYVLEEALEHQCWEDDTTSLV